MIVSVVGTKGGIGKTTLAVQLAASYATSGKRTLLIDGDRQRSATMSIINRCSDRPDLPSITAAHYPEGRALRAQVIAQQDLYSRIVIDVGGADSTALRAALMVSNAVVIPVRPRNYEIWSLEDISKLISEARAQRDDFPALVVLNLADPGVLARDNSDAAAAAGEIEGLDYLEAPIVQRKSISTASAEGLAVGEMTSKDPKAIFEIERFVSEIDIAIFRYSLNHNYRKIV